MKTLDAKVIAEYKQTVQTSDIESPLDRKTRINISRLMSDGYVNIGSILNSSDLIRLHSAAEKLEQKNPFGFINAGPYSQVIPSPRLSTPKASDNAPTVIYPNAGFMEPDILIPLKYPEIHAIIESAIGKDYYLSNTWLQIVPPGTGRLGYHKDPRGSVTFTLMLDDINKAMGSTCLVPRSHINTPPPLFCMRNIEEEQPDETDLTGKAGDVIFFSPETWHGRSANLSSTKTRRLFFNFYSRSSRTTTSWAKSVDAKTVTESMMILPDIYHRMFEIDTDLSNSLQNGVNNAQHIFAGSKSHKNFFNDISHSRRSYGVSTFTDNREIYIKPYTPRFMESSNFSLAKYISRLDLLSTSKILTKYLLRRST